MEKLKQTTLWHSDKMRRAIDKYIKINGNMSRERAIYELVAHSLKNQIIINSLPPFRK